MPGPTRNVGAKVVLDGEKEYKQALNELSAGNKTLASEMRKLQAEYKGNTESTEYLTKAGELLERKLLQQQDKVAKLREAVAFAAKEYGEASERTQYYIQQLNNAEAAEFDLQHAIEENNAALNGQNEEMVGLGDTVDQLAGKLGINLPQGAKEALNGMKGLSAGTVAAMAAAATAIAAVVKVVSELGKLTIEVAAQVDEYLSESAITGVPVEILQAWDYAAPLIDTDAETIKSAMTKITKAMGDAAGGSESAQEKFAALGVAITNEADGSLRSAEEVFYDVIDALGQMQAGTERDALAMELLGKSAQELNPLINEGSDALRKYAEEAEAAGYILDEQQTRKLGEVDDAYQKLQLQIEANRKQLAADFAPAAKAAMELFTDVVRKAGEMLERSGIIKNLASIIESLIDILRTAGDILQGIPGFKQGLSMISSVLGGIAQFCALIADTADVIGGLFQVITGSGGGRMAGLERIGNAMGFGKSSGTLSHWQTVYMQQEGTYDQYQEYYANKRGESFLTDYGYDPETRQYYDKNTGNYIIYGTTAGGSDNWRGGLTWVGEAGPELVALPQGSRIYSNQESQQMGGSTTFNITVNGVQELDEIISWYRSRQIRERMA
ncbi:MAG: hypothetical protein IIY43_02875 [Oscillospiraceae bacterium]|nr:hypothetical protein [Oscillospiraceae bacterium]